MKSFSTLRKSILKNNIRPVFTFCLILFSFIAHCQIKDTTIKKPSKKFKQILNAAVNSVKRNGHDSTALLAVGAVRKNEEPFLPYQDKIIRHIIIRQIPFEKKFEDTSQEVQYPAKSWVHLLHRNTREKVIRNNLFIKEQTPLNAFRIADNERYLRSLEYIQDARIIVRPVAGSKDSVDVIVITKDVFSVAVELQEVTQQRFKAKLSDANVLGLAQRVNFQTLEDKYRSPHFGYELYYSKNNIAGSFVNTTFGFTSIQSDLRLGLEDEHSWYLRLERPLVSQYKHFAGGLTIAKNKTFNDYKLPDSLFYKYDYNTFDLWGGYNIDMQKNPHETDISERRFISVRYFKNSFVDIPYQVDGKFNFRYNNREAMLGQLTFFRQSFYKTNYLFGFGITEDVPHGYNIALTAGWYKQVRLERFYAGINAYRYAVTNDGDVIQYFLRTGSFLHTGQFQDAAVLGGVSMFSRLYPAWGMKLRQYFRMSYTRQFNRLGLDPLNISNAFGLKDYNSDSTTGNQRLSVHLESIFFLKFHLVDFKFAPFAFGDLVMLSPEYNATAKRGLYYGFGGGVRTRNENIIFGTIELRFIYFPRRTDDVEAFKISVTTNLRIRYNNNYVKPPDIIQLNNDEDNIY